LQKVPQQQQARFQQQQQQQQQSPSGAYNTPYYNNVYNNQLDGMMDENNSDHLLGSDSSMYGRWSQGDTAYRRQQQQGKKFRDIKLVNIANPITV
jgi:hypothetical protein